MERCSKGRSIVLLEMGGGTNLGAKKRDRLVGEQVARLNTFERHVNEAAEQWEQVLSRCGSGQGLFTAACSRPPALLQTLSCWAGYAGELEQTMQVFNNMPAGINPARWEQTKAAVIKNIASNPLTRPFAGTSLEDISRMPLPLRAVDIGRIDLMVNNSARIDPNQCFDPETYIKSVVMMAATAAEHYPKFPLSENVRPLLQGLKKYWEHYALLALKSDVPDNSYWFLFRMVIGNQLPGLLSFMPARLHISPSSAYRIIDAHLENISPSLFRRVLRRVNPFKSMPACLDSVSSALDLPARPAGGPPEIARYQTTGLQAEAELVVCLSRFYQGRAAGVGSDFVSDGDGPSVPIRKKLSLLYRKRLVDAIRTADEGFLRIPVGTGNFFREILVGAFYGRTLTIIGLTEDERRFVTLDLTQGGRLFGIPHGLERINPVATRLLAYDLLNPVLEEAKVRYPFVEYTPNGSKYTPAPFRETAAVSKDAADKVAKPPKKRALRAIGFIRPKAADISEESLPVEQEENGHTLFYKDQIVSKEGIESLAKKIAAGLWSNEQKLAGDIKLILDALTENPKGDGCYKLAAVGSVYKNDRQVPLWGFRGDERKLPFVCGRFSKRLRTVYWIGSGSVHLIEVTTHDKFDKSYSSGRMYA